MAREALRLSPDCVDAHVLLAEQTGDPEEERRFFAEAVAAGERVLGSRLEVREGHFWRDVTTRPFLRALEGLASVEGRLGMVSEAIQHYERVLFLNPEDNQGVRWPLAALLLEAGHDDAFDGLLHRYAKDDSTLMAYAAALRAFRAHGDAAASRRALRRAVKRNPHVVDVLLGLAAPPAGGSFAPGSIEEAAYCAVILEAAWERTPGALEWLEERERSNAEAARRNDG
jgi:tetratricopeptide (TPR) repeat protein